MAQLRIKRSTGSTAPSSSALANAELAFTENNEILFYGKGTSGSNAASVVKVGGVGAFCDLETSQTIGGAKTFSSNVIVSGNLTVNGTTTTIATTNTTVSDNILELNSGASSNGNDCGILIERGSTGNNAFLGWDESADQFIVGTTTATADSTGNLSISIGTLQANVTGSAVSLANSRNIALTGNVTGSASFNGTADASITTTIANESVTEAMLDIHNSPTDGYILKYDNTNGLVWGAAGSGGDVNQNAFSNIAVSGQTTVAADSTTDTATFVGAGGLAITTDASSDEITFTIGTLNQNTTGNAATATTATNIIASANNSTDETVYLTFIDAATGTKGLETDTGLSYNPSSGLLTVGQIDGGSF